MKARAIAATFLLATVLSGVLAGVAHGQTAYGYYPWCDPAPEHPIQLALPVPGLVVACRNEDWTSVHLRNVSAHVLRVEPMAGYASPDIWQVDDGDDAPGVRAAQFAVASAWYDDGVFRLSLGESAVVSANGPVGVEWRPDPSLTAEANVARWTAGRLSQLAEEQQRPLGPSTRWYRLVDSCAEAGKQAFADGNLTIGRVLSIAMSGRTCKKLVGEALGTTKPSAIKGIAGDIVYVARPVAEEKILLSVLRHIAR